MNEKLFIPLNATKPTGTSHTSPTERPNKSIELGKWIKRFFGISLQGDSNLVLNQQGEWVTGGSGGNTMHYISNADPDLYGGTPIWLFKNNNGDIQSTGFGKFYNPKYNQSVDDLGIWSNVGTYTIGDKTIWGGRAWTNLNGNVGTNLSIYELDSTEWEVIPYDDVNYNVAYAPITYDIANDFISGRKEVESNIEVSCSYEIAKRMYGGYGFPSINPIKAIQWGNPFNADNSRGHGGIAINNSYVESINAKGLYVDATANNNSIIDNITVENNSNIGIITANSSRINNLTADNSSNINTLTAENSSKISNLTANSSNISNITVNSSKINNLTAENNGSINTLTANNSNINNLTAENSSNINNLTVENGVISNLTIDNEKQLSKISVSGINYDFLGQTESNFDLIGLVATSKSVEFGFTLNFDGSAGKGEVGAITMPCWVVPEGFICTQTISKTITPLVSAGTSQVTLGYETDQADAIISLDSSAFVDVRLDTHAMGFIPTTQTRRIVGEVTGDAITSGTVEFQVKFSKV